MSKPEYTPLSELNPAICNLPIPEYVDPERIGVDMARIGRIAAWGGFREQARITSYNGETTSYSVGVAGHSGGNATASAAGVARKADMSRQEYNDEGIDFIRPVRSLTLQLNSAEITDQIHRKQQPIREPQTWATHLDKTVRTGLVKASWQNMVGTRPTRSELILAATIFGFIGLESEDGYGLYNTDYPFLMVMGQTVLLTVSNLNSIAQLAYQDVSFKEAHFSIVPAWHVDRAAIATIGAARRKVIKVLPENQK